MHEIEAITLDSFEALLYHFGFYLHVCLVECKRNKKSGVSEASEKNDLDR